MFDTTPNAPSTAERIRSTMIGAGGAILAVDGVEPCSTPVHHLFPDGTLAVIVPTAGEVFSTVTHCTTGGLDAVLELTDYAPLPLREPVRSLVWISGMLRGVTPAERPGLLDAVAENNPDPTLLRVNSPTASAALSLLRLRITSVVVADATGAGAVDVDELLGARPDPFCAVESGWLQHLDATHRDVVDRLAARLPAKLRRGRVRPLGLDRYGVRLRIERDDADHDVRLAFPRPVDDATSLCRAIRALMGCPFGNGLQARQR